MHVGGLHVLCIALPSLVLLFVPAFFLQVPGALLYPLPGRASPYSACALSGGLHAGLALCVVLPGFPCHVWCPVWAISDIQSVHTGWVSARVTVYLSIYLPTFCLSIYLPTFCRQSTTALYAAVFGSRCACRNRLRHGRAISVLCIVAVQYNSIAMQHYGQSCGSRPTVPAQAHDGNA